MWTKSKCTFILFMFLATRSTDIQRILYLPSCEKNFALPKYINKLYFEQSDENILYRKDFINFLLLKFIKINNRINEIIKDITIKFESLKNDEDFKTQLKNYAKEGFEFWFKIIIEDFTQYYNYFMEKFHCFESWILEFTLDPLFLNLKDAGIFRNLCLKYFRDFYNFIVSMEDAKNVRIEHYRAKCGNFMRLEEIESKDFVLIKPHKYKIEFLDRVREVLTEFNKHLNIFRIKIDPELATI
ncbi:hypothetical protein H312_01278 [Anncaliia algerae PRA339]|uniref:Uncharacterized protein n=1 Tax=Anncaliia algerae PRA339 TaxID=1288291 RepID=A0A059F2E3_9MICR|nr:hypothetical protein H312_01278 [Anncaliia algerae PRA339]